MKQLKNKKIALFSAFIFFSLLAGNSWALDKLERRQQELDQTQKEFSWWPTDAKPAPVKDREQSGYWWWPEVPGQSRPWGNRGYVYVYKIIYDY